MNFIPINRPILGDEERKVVDEVLSSGALTDSSLEGGKWVRSFESKMRTLLGVRDAVAVSSGTAALHSALVACGIKSGDEVIIPSFTFVATANAVLACGATPVFADTKADYNIEAAEVAKKVTGRTKVILPVHVYGYPADLTELKEIAERNSLALIEDAAESLGAEYKGKQTGSETTAGCFSLYATKVITSGEGGAVSTNDEELAHRLRMVRNHGMVKGYDTRVLGLNLRLPEVQAAIASVQMDRLPSFLQLRRRNASSLLDQTRNLPGVEMTQNASDRNHIWYLFTLNVKRNRDDVMARMRKAGVGASVYWEVPVHKTPYYSELGFSVQKLPNTERASRMVLSLPVHPGVTLDQIDYIAASLKDALRELR